MGCGIFPEAGTGTSSGHWPSFEIGGTEASYKWWGAREASHCCQLLCSLGVVAEAVPRASLWGAHL